MALTQAKETRETGEPDAVKVARPVRRGAGRKGGLADLARGLPYLDGVPIHRLRRLLQWPRERFDAVLEALRATQAVDLAVLTGQAVDDQVTHDSYQVHGQCYGRLRWRA